LGASEVIDYTETPNWGEKLVMPPNWYPQALMWTR